MSHHNHCNSFIESHWSLHFPLWASLGSTWAAQTWGSPIAQPLFCRAFLGWDRATLRVHPGELGCLSSPGTPDAPSPAPRHSSAPLSEHRDGIRALFSLWGLTPPFPALQPVPLGPALKGRSGQQHLLVLVEFSCTFHFEYDLQERFAQSYFTRPTVPFQLGQEINKGARAGHLQGLWIIY